MKKVIILIFIMVTCLIFIHSFSPHIRYLTGYYTYELGCYKIAFYEFKYLANKGNIAAQAFLGSMYLNGFGADKDYSQGYIWSKKAALAGLASAQHDLGQIYLLGWGVKRDLNKAATWHRMAAEKGYAPSQNNLGSLYVTGQGVEKDYHLALDWYRKVSLTP